MYGRQGDGRFRLANTRCGSLPDGGIGMTDMSLSKAGGGRSGPIRGADSQSAVPALMRALVPAPKQASRGVGARHAGVRAPQAFGCHNGLWQTHDHHAS